MTLRDLRHQPLSDSPTKRPARYRHALIAFVAVATILVPVLLGWKLRSEPEVVATLEISKALQTPVCRRARNSLSAISEYREEGRLQLALERAELALVDTDRPLCESSRQRIAKLWYVTVVDLIFSTPTATWYDPQLQARVLQEWQELQTDADRYGVDDLDRLTHTELFRRADSYPLLADWAYRQAAEQGRAQAIPPKVRMDFLVDWGSQMLQSPIGAAQDEGLIHLATAVEISHRYTLDTGEACRLLAEARPSSSCRKAASFDASEPLLEVRDG